MAKPAPPDISEQKAYQANADRFTYPLPFEPVYANLDVNKFRQVLINLVSNPRVRHRHWDALLPVLFEWFSPAVQPGLHGESTNGLGLLLCKTIVEWHHHGG